jgi:hypothetical protein
MPVTSKPASTSAAVDGPTPRPSLARQTQAA